MEFVLGTVAFFDLQAGIKLAIFPHKSIFNNSSLQLNTPSPTDFTFEYNASSKHEIDAVVAQVRPCRCRHRKAASENVLGWLCWLYSTGKEGRVLIY